jgi:hypothetical protein
MPCVLGSRVPYSQYLQAQVLIDDVKGALARERKHVSLAVESGTREIVASPDALHDQGVRLQTAVREGFDQLSWDIQELSGAVQHLNAAFEWGFNAILGHTGYGSRGPRGYQEQAIGRRNGHERLRSRVLH